MRTWSKLIRQTSGATSIEYGLISGLLAIGLVASIGSIGKQLSNVFAILSSPSGPPPSTSGNAP